MANPSQRTAIQLHLDEQDTTLHASDKASGLLPMKGDTGATPDLVLPTVVQTSRGFARQFTTDSGLVGDEDTSGQTEIPRDVTLECICEPDLAAMSVSDIGVIVQRGGGGTTAERILYGLRITKTAASEFLLEMAWEEKSGTLAVVAGVSVAVGADGGDLYIVAVRRWNTITDSTVLFYLNGELLGTETVSESDIGEGVGGQTYVGCNRQTAASVDFENFFKGTIESVRVSCVERDAEEIRQIYRKAARFEPRGYAGLYKLLPSDVYSIDPASTVQREVQNEGGGIGMALADAHQLSVDGLPDRSWNLLDRWEKVTRRTPRPGDAVATRRAAVLGSLRGTGGFTRQGIADALAAPFDLDESLITFVEGTNFFTDDFASTIAQSWTQFLGLAATGTITITAGEIDMFADRLACDYKDNDATILYRPIGANLQGRPTDPVRIDATIKVTAEALSNASFFGVCAFNNASRNLFVMGILGSSTNVISTLAWLPAVDAAFRSGPTIETPLPSLPIWFRIRYDGGGQWTTYWSTVGPDDISNPTVRTGEMTDPSEVGLILTGNGVPAVDLDVQADDWRSWMEFSDAPYQWAAVRDPAEPGTADLATANEIVRRLKPGHTNGSAVNVTTGFECDDPDSLTDRDLLGG